jgi:hypothetical protein
MCLGPEIALVAQIIGTVAAVGGTALSVHSAQQQAEASEKAEKLRRKQMDLEIAQRRRTEIRKFQLNRATAASNIQGATGSLEGSAFPGAVSGYTSTLGTQLGEISQSASIGAGIFDANAQASAASAGVQTGQGLTSFGKDLFSSGPQIGRIGATLLS